MSERRLLVDTHTSLKIMNLRRAGWGYKRIAQEMGCTRDEARNICQAHNVTPEDGMCEQVCAWCGSAMPGRTRRAIYCSSACRRAAWRTLAQADGPTKRCAACARPFHPGDKPSRKYCSHACYIKSRFGTRGGRP